jgi:hypothetical protein
MKHARDDDPVDNLPAHGGLPVHNTGQASGVTKKSYKEVDFEVVRDDAVYLWPYAEAPAALRENFEVPSRFICYIPEHLRKSVGPPEHVFAIEADPKCLQIVEQGDGALVVSLF